MFAGGLLIAFFLRMVADILVALGGAYLAGLLFTGLYVLMVLAVCALFTKYDTLNSLRKADKKVRDEKLGIKALYVTWRVVVFEDIERAIACWVCAPVFFCLSCLAWSHAYPALFSHQPTMSEVMCFVANSTFGGSSLRCAVLSENKEALAIQEGHALFEFYVGSFGAFISGVLIVATGTLLRVFMTINEAPSYITELRRLTRHYDNGDGDDDQ